MDAFLSIHTWHRWQDLFELAHIAVMHRPGQPTIDAHHDGLHESIKAILQHSLVTDYQTLLRHSVGKIIIQEVSQLDISATAIRDMVKQGKSPRYLIPDAVLQIIEKNHLYC